MSVKVFISYAHEDENYKKALIEHLASLKRSELISEWHDRKIIAGQSWGNEISINLEKSELILFLISSAFVNSDYCVDLEVKKAIEMHKSGKAILIPIFIRPVVWEDSELLNIQGLPKDLIPVSQWSNTDEAWVDVVLGIKECISQFELNKPKLELQPLINDELSLFKQTDELLSWFDDTEVVFTHRKVNRVKLSDIFVLPDVRVFNDDKDEYEIQSLDFLTSQEGLYILAGEEQQGKTTLLKHLFQEYLRQCYVPVYIDSIDIKTSKLPELLEIQLAKQYVELTVDKFLNQNKKVILIDNFDKIGLNLKHQNLFLENVCKFFDYVIITCHSSFEFISSEVERLREFKHHQLISFGNLKREELVRKWVVLGEEESISDEILYKEADSLQTRLNAAIKKNIVPPKPYYVLMLIQLFEAHHQHNLTLSSYGHCYQELIYQALGNARIPNIEYDKYFNVMTELSWAIHKNGKGLTPIELEKFFTSYRKDYLSVNEETIIENLKNCNILDGFSPLIEFKYSYIFYFFVGKKIAESYNSEPDVTEEVDVFLDNLHREDYSNILIFVTHHSKETWLIGKLNDVIGSLFADNTSTTLEKEDLKFIESFIREIPELVLEQKNIQEERDKYNKRLDELDSYEIEGKDNINENTDDEMPLDILATINKTLKGIDISGQIIRNRYASLKRHDINHLAEGGIEAGLRFLDFFIAISDFSKKEIIEFIKNGVDEHPNEDNNVLSMKAEHIFLQMTYGVINVILRKIASSIGSKEAIEIYSELGKTKNTPAYALLTQAIELQYTRNLNIKSVEKTLIKLQNNPVCIRILKEIILQHIYMFPVEYKVKQQLSSKLGFDMKLQRRMDARKIGKGSL